jgi:hypothetical protein
MRLDWDYSEPPTGANTQPTSDNTKTSGVPTRPRGPENWGKTDTWTEREED